MAELHAVKISKCQSLVHVGIPCMSSGKAYILDATKARQLSQVLVLTLEGMGKHSIHFRTGQTYFHGCPSLCGTASQK